MQNGAGYKIALATQGTRGDFQPMLALAVGFRKHGHTVRVYCNPDHCNMAKAYGVDAVESCFEVKDMLKTPEGMKAMETGDLVAAAAAFAEPEDGPDYNRIFVEDMVEFQPDVCLYTPLIGGKIAAYCHHARENVCPMINCSYQPQAFPTEDFGPIPMYRVQLEKGQPMLSKWVMFFQSNAQQAHEAFQAFKDTNPPEEQLNAVEGPEGTYLSQFDVGNNPEPHILAYSKAFWPAPKDWPEEGKGFSILGQWQFSKEEQEEQTKKGASMFSEGDEFQRCVDFIKAGSTPVYIGWGSMTVYSKEHMAILASETLMKSGQRGIIVSGWAGMDLSCLDTAKEPEALKAYCQANVLFMRAAPHEWLFPQCAVCVHHGGIGTAQASLRAGTPTVVTPVFADQHDIANQITKEGWGLGTCLLAKLTSDELAEKVKACVGNATMKEKVTALAEKMRKEDGVTATVEYVTSWIRDVAKTGKLQEMKNARQKQILEMRQKTGKMTIERIFAFFQGRIREKYPQLKEYEMAQMEITSHLATLASQNKLWVVCASSCLAKAGEKLKTEEKGRYKEFAMLEELELKDKRLHVKLVKGVGPDQGWVSLQVNSVDLVKRIGPREIAKVYADSMAKQFADVMPHRDSMKG